MGKLDVECMRHLSKNDFRVLVAVEMGMKVRVTSCAFRQGFRYYLTFERTVELVTLLNILREEI